jgi:hypothetical protein
MDDVRFDGFARALGSRATRRSALGLAVATNLVAALGAGGAAAGKRKRCKPRCNECEMCKKGRCKQSPDGTGCGAFAEEFCVAGRCIFPCTGGCGGICNECAQTYDTRQGYCGGDGDKTCDNVLPCANHAGCSTGELCAAMNCPAVNGITNRCQRLCAA